ncbi:hypothetical protein OC842_005344 [Tilletia horrida]|uniref:DNA replication regulator SLD2 n=1 Tax=Tilletia horrida TaxID=155126 RepID=A0AAN6G821_9BASI|nr:hypothetical protein OC842_005344 [Tilletia horrida]
MESILRKQLKDFQRTFTAQHGRAPSKSDVAKEPGIKAAYDAWHAIRKASGQPASSSSSSSVQKAMTDGGASSTLKRANASSATMVATQERDHAQGGSSSSSTTVLATPRRKPGGSSAAPFATPTSTRKKTNPFATPSAAAATADAATPQRSKPARPPTPSTIVKIYVTPPHLAASAHAGLEDDSQFDYANSPTRLKALIAARSSPRTAAAKGTGGALPAFTPRTKARKRLRGEFVPPTPATSRMQQKGEGGGEQGEEDAEGDEEDEEEGEEEKDAPEGMGRPLKRRRNLGGGTEKSRLARTITTTNAASALNPASATFGPSSSSSFKRSITAPALLSSRPGALQTAQRSRGAYLAELELDYPTPPPSQGSGQLEYPGLGSKGGVSSSGGAATGPSDDKSSERSLSRTRSFRRTSSRAVSIFAKSGGANSEAESSAKNKGKAKESIEDVAMAEVSAGPSGSLSGQHAHESATGSSAVASVRPANSGPRWALSQIEISDGESDSTATDAPVRGNKRTAAATRAARLERGSPNKHTITLAPYLRHGTLRARLEQDERKRAALAAGRSSSSSPSKGKNNSAEQADEDAMQIDGPSAGLKDDDQDDDDDDELAYALPTACRFAHTSSDPVTRSNAPPRAAERRAAEDSSAVTASDGRLTERLTAQNRFAAHAQRARSRAMIRALLGEMEELDLDSEQQTLVDGGTKAAQRGPGSAVPAKNWGQAKENNRDPAVAAAGKKKGPGTSGRKSKKELEAAAGVATGNSGATSSAATPAGKKGAAAGPSAGGVAQFLRQFARVGRAGIAAAEMSDRSDTADEEGEDDDNDEESERLDDDEEEEEEEEEEDRGQDADESCIDSPSEENGERSRSEKRLRQRRLNRQRSRCLRPRSGSRRAGKGRDNDDDWDSEVGSDEYGLGDGQMDETDVI